MDGVFDHCQGSHRLRGGSNVLNDVLNDGGSGDGQHGGVVDVGGVFNVSGMVNVSDMIGVVDMSGVLSSSNGGGCFCQASIVGDVGDAGVVDDLRAGNGGGGGGGSLMHLCMVNLSPSSSLGLHPASGNLETPVPVGVHPPGGGNPGARASPGKGDLGLQLLLVTAQVPLVLLQPRHLRGVTGVGAADVRGDGCGGGTAGQLVPPTLDALPGPEGVEPGTLVLLLVLPAKGGEPGDLGLHRPGALLHAASHLLPLSEPLEGGAAQEGATATAITTWEFIEKHS